MTTIPQWVPLERGDDWGMEYLAYTALTPYGSASAARAIRPVAGSSFELRWPDNTVTTENIVYKDGWNVVSDHGHESRASFSIPGFNAKIHGLCVWVPLDAPGLLVHHNAF
jgi:hypothetical protein